MRNRPRGRCGSRNLTAALQDAALEIGADIDRHLFGGNIAIDIGRGDELDLFAGDTADDAAADLDIVGRDIALDRTGLADDQTADTDIALDRAVNLKIASARDTAVELEVR